MGPTPKQVVGIVLILGAALVAMPLQSDHAILACAIFSVIGVGLLLKGGRKV
jgi:hypothetical protein